MKHSLLLVFALCFMMAPAQDIFEKDPTWNPYTIPNNQHYLDGYYFVKSEVQADGKLMVAVTNYSSVPTTSLARLDGNVLDTSFTTGSFNGLITDFVIQPDGKIVVVGAFTTYEDLSAKYIVRLNSDGTRDTSFLIGNGFNNEAEAVEIQVDGKLLVAGEDISNYNGQSTSSITRIHTDGSLDTTFTYDASAYSLGVQSIALQPDGKLLLGDHGRLYRTLTDGTLDPTWALNGPQATEPTFTSNYGEREIRKIVVLPDGKLLVGGQFEEAFNGSTRRDLVRLNADGSLDNTFYNQGLRYVTGYREGVSSIVVLPDGKLIIGGDFTSWHLQSDTDILSPKSILKLNTDGTLDTSFLGHASFSLDYDDENRIKSIHTTPDGHLICTGSINSYNGIAVNNIVKIDTDGNRDATFHNICKGFNGRVLKIVQQPNNQILVSGHFSMYNGTTCDRLVRLNEDGSIDPNFEANTYQFLAHNRTIADMAVQADGKILIVSRGRYFNGQSGGSFVRLNADGSIDTTFVSLTPGDYGLSGSYKSVRVLPDGKILTVGKTNNDNAIKRFNIDGTLDTSFDFTAYSNINEIQLQPDGMILFSYHTGGGISNYKIGRLLSDGQLDTSFSAPSGLPGVTNFTLQPDGKVLCFSDITSGHDVFRLLSDGSLDTGFSFPSSQSYQSENTAHALLPDGKILMGVRLFSSLGFPNYLIRRNSDGSEDASFEIGTGFAWGLGYGPTIAETISDVDVDSQGRILVGGAFKIFDGQPEHGFVRIQPENFLSTPSQSAEGAFMVHPNPVKDRLYITMKDGKMVDNVALFSLSGRRIMSSKKTELDLSFLQTGVYILKISSGTQTEQHKLIKQ